MGRECATLRKPSLRLAAHTLRGRIRRDQLGVGCLKRFQLLHQAIKVRITQFGRIQHVIKVLVAADFIAQLFYRFFNTGLGSSTGLTPGTRLAFPTWVAGAFALRGLFLCFGVGFIFGDCGHATIIFVSPPMKKVCLLYNLASGRKREQRAQQISHIAGLFREHGMQVEAWVTTHAGSAVQQTQDAAAAGFDTVLACGGDGTFNEVLNGVMRAGPQQPAIGVIPLGSGNLLATDLRLPSNPVAAARSHPRI